MYWWVSHGIPAGGMPGFADRFAEDERWDIVNFLHTLAAGYQARMIRESVAPRAPWLAAPDFVVATATGVTVHLQDYRQRQESLLVLYSLPGSAPRLEQLRRAAELFVEAGAAVTMVPIESKLGDEVSSTPSGAGEQVAAAYRLFRRTLVNPRAGEIRAGPAHMEFLIDRYGFIRARWVPEDGTAGWADISVLLTEIRALAAEGRVRDPPDAHLH
jgi:putative copper resistance protein D